jgi:uncharacterized membrane protein
MSRFFVIIKLKYPDKNQAFKGADEMPETIESYNSQQLIKNLSRKARLSWGVITALALSWIVLIISAPIAKSGGFDGFSNSVYGFFSYLCHQMSWRSYHVGEYPMAVCARCFGFYGGFLLGLIIYPLFRPLHNTEPFSRVWLFLALIPMGVDWSLEYFGIWNNTHFTRLFSGLILGAACAFFIVPALVEINYFLGEKFRGRSKTS